MLIIIAKVVINDSSEHVNDGREHKVVLVAVVELVLQLALDAEQLHHKLWLAPVACPTNGDRVQGLRLHDCILFCSLLNFFLLQLLLAVRLQLLNDVHYLWVIEGLFKVLQEAGMEGGVLLGTHVHVVINDPQKLTLQNGYFFGR